MSWDFILLLLGVEECLLLFSQLTFSIVTDIEKRKISQYINVLSFFVWRCNGGNSVNPDGLSGCWKIKWTKNRGRGFASWYYLSVLDRPNIRKDSENLRGCYEALRSAKLHELRRKWRRINKDDSIYTWWLITFLFWGLTQI